jgi:hypothetical protein
MSVNPTSTKRSNWSVLNYKFQNINLYGKIRLIIVIFLLKMFSNILNFNPRPKNPTLAVWASSADVKQQAELTKPLGRKVQFLTPHSADSDQSVYTIIPYPSKYLTDKSGL